MKNNKMTNKIRFVPQSFLTKVTLILTISLILTLTLASCKEDSSDKSTTLIGKWLKDDGLGISYGQDNTNLLTFTYTNESGEHMYYPSALDSYDGTTLTIYGVGITETSFTAKISGNNLTVNGLSMLNGKDPGFIPIDVSKYNGTYTKQ